MRTIEITDDMYAKLMEISKEMTTQDNRGTAMPYFFQVQETKKVPAHNECGEEMWYNHECEQELRTKEEKIEWLTEDAHEMSVHISSHELIELQFKSLDDYKLNALIRSKGFERFYEQDNHEYSNAFFTSKGLDEHIRINGHNLHNPVNYLSHAYRNSEMELMFEFLCGLSGKKIHK